MGAAVLFCLSAAAQPNPANVYAAGVSYSPGGSPTVAGTALYARSVDTSGTYAFTVLDALPISVKPFSVDTAVAAGVAQRVFSLGNVGVYVPTAAGISYMGTHTGWQWSTGALLSIPIKGNWSIMPNARLLKSSVSDNAGYQIIGGLMVSWGK
jgi:hypothetical protein